MFQGIKICLKDIVFYSQFWGLYNALRIRLYPKILDFFKPGSYSKKQNQVLSSLLKKEFEPIIEKYRKIKNNPLPITKETPIWVCWWQGEDQMPEMIRQCYKIMQKNSNGHPVILITENNYTEYIELPQIIKDRVKNHNITFTFLSDIIRMSLLAKHGGIWIDATYWVTKPISINDIEFFSIRQDRFKGQGGFCDFRWTCHCIGAGSPYYIFSFIKDCFIQHLTLHKTNVIYLLIDYVINLAYEEFEDFKDIIDNLPNHEPHIYIMPWLFNQKYNDEKLKEILETTPLLKLTLKWEKPFVRKTPEGEDTYYNYFIKL